MSKRRIVFPKFNQPTYVHLDIEKVIEEGSKSMPEVWEGVREHAREVHRKLSEQERLRLNREPDED